MLQFIGELISMRCKFLNYIFFSQRSLTGIQDLDEVVFLEMKVNTVQNSLGNFGKIPCRNIFFRKIGIRMCFELSILHNICANVKKQY